jgi:prophage antirepressor-like protein
MKTHEKFLQFNGKTIYFQSYDGQFWIAIKPICEALNVNYNPQVLALKNDVFFKDAYTLQYMHDSSNRLQKMICLPEKYIYGWLLSINSSSQELRNYKKECYEILYNYFHGTITGRKELLKLQIETDIEINIAESELLQSEAFQKLQELKKKSSTIKKELSKNDKEVKDELTLFNYEKIKI